MSIEVRWENDTASILYFRFTGEWSWVQLRKQLDMAAALAKGAVHSVAAIIDVSAGVVIPGGNVFIPENIDQLKALLNRGHDRRGMILVVGANAETRIIYDCLRMIDARVGWQVFFADTPDEARAYIHLRRTTGSISSNPVNTPHHRLSAPL